MKEMEEVIISTLEGTDGSSSSSVNRNTENITGMDPKFYTAAMEANIDAFKDKGKEIECILTPNKNTILHIHFTAYTVSEEFMVNILHMCPTIIMKPNAKGETLLHIASRYGHSTIVKKLIEIAKVLPEVGSEKMVIRAINEKKDTALHEAVYFHHMEIVDILTKEDPDYPYFGNSDGETPLYVAAEREYWDVVLKILNNCISPNQNGPNGRTALHVAVIRENGEMMSKLLTRTSVKQADENGWVPLHLAALKDYSYLIEELLKYDKDTSYMKDKRGRTALHLAAYFGHDNNMEKIIEHCPDCAELVDENGYNALHYTVLRGNDWATKLILEKASLSNLYNEKDDSGNTPLHYITSSSTSYNSFNPLLEGHPRVDAMAFNKNNQTVIDMAFDDVQRRLPISSSDLEPQYLVRKLGEIGAKYGGRIIKNKDDERKKKQEETQEDEVRNNETERIRETIMVVSTLIATITFAAGFTMPGGTIQDGQQQHQGSPILKHNFAFRTFIVTDTISFVFSASSVLSLIFSSFSYKYDSHVIYDGFVKMALGLCMLALVFMIIAFVTGTLAVLGFSDVLGVETLFIGLSFFFVLYLGVETIKDSSPEQIDFVKPDDLIINAQEIQLSQFDTHV